MMKARIQINCFFNGGLSLSQKEGIFYLGIFNKYFPMGLDFVNKQKKKMLAGRGEGGKKTDLCS